MTHGEIETLAIKARAHGWRTIAPDYDAMTEHDRIMLEAAIMRLRGQFEPRIIINNTVGVE